jgi:hypothetical protein
MVRPDSAHPGETVHGTTRQGEEKTMRTIGQLTEQGLKLQVFIEGLDPGREVSFIEAATYTGIKMDLAGRSALRRAIRRAKREYSPMVGYGVRLADAAGVMPILSTRIRRIDGSVKRADNSQKLLQEQFFESLSAEDQKRILFAGAVFGAIRVAAEQGKMIYKKQQVSGPTIHIPLPDVG